MLTHSRNSHLKMSSAAVLTAEKSGARQIPKSNYLQPKKQELVNGSPPQGNANETVESLYQKVEDLALAEVLIPPTPLMISFSLLSFEDCDAAFEAMVSVPSFCIFQAF